MLFYLAHSANLPTGLYIFLALISSFFSLFFYYDQSYLSIYWTDFHDLFTEWKVFVNFLDPVHFFRFLNGRSMATNFVSYQTCSLGAKVSQDLLDRFSQSLHHTVGIELWMIIMFYIFRYLKGRCYGNQLKSKNWRFLRTNLLCRAAIRKWTAISQF